MKDRIQEKEKIKTESIINNLDTYHPQTDGQMEFYWILLC